MKKIIVFLFVLLACALSVIWWVTGREMDPKGCAFCHHEVLKAQVFYEGDQSLGMLTYKPAVLGHVLIIPKRHVERYEELTREEMGDLGETIRKVDLAVRQVFGEKGYVLIQKNGKDAGQSVPHVHFHYLPADRFLAIRFLTAHWFAPMKGEKTAEWRESLSKSLLEAQGH